MAMPSSSDDRKVKELLDRALYLFAGNEAALDAWLHRPDPQLGDMTPEEVIAAGRPELVASIVEEALRGIPD
jgi:uncharacterized protein (DUF2384 family)